MLPLSPQRVMVKRNRARQRNSHVLSEVCIWVEGERSGWGGGGGREGLAVHIHDQNYRIITWKKTELCVITFTK